MTTESEEERRWCAEHLGDYKTCPSGGSNALVEVKDLTGDEVLDHSGECHSK